MSTDSTLARALHQFFLNYLPKQRSTSPHTVQSYRDSLKLLLKFVVNRVGVGAQLEVEHITVERILAFLEHLETARHNGASTRNVRLSAIHSFFRYLGAQYVQHLALSQRILGIPFKRTGSREIQHLEQSEIKAVVDGIDRSTSAGRRDYALLSLLFNSGARVSEVVALKARDFRLASPPHVMLRGKGRKERTCPLWTETANVLREYMEEQHIAPHDEAKSVFPNQCGQPLTRFGIRFIVKKHVHNAAAQMPCLRRKRLHPHSLRHSTAIFLLRSGVDLSTIAHWLGHVSVNTTNKYLKVDMEAKREALAKAKPLFRRTGKSGDWRKNPDLVGWLEAL
jgi:integrase/recombinase XerD